MNLGGQGHGQEALKRGDKERLGTIRMLIAALKNERIAKMRDLKEEETIAVLQRELKRRVEAAELYRKGEKQEMAEKEEREALQARIARLTGGVAVLKIGASSQAGQMELAGNATMLFYMTEEGQEGRNAFVEKRPPDFNKFGRNP